MCLSIIAKIESVQGSYADVSVSGARTRICLEILGERVNEGDYVLVHTGYAIARMDKEEAEQTLAEMQKVREGWKNESE